jgi:hypothetical protein
MSPNLLHSATIFLLTRSNKKELEFWFARAYRVVKYRKNGAPDTIRTCDLCLRRANANQPCCPPPTEIEGASTWMSHEGFAKRQLSAVVQTVGFGLGRSKMLYLSMGID